MAKESIANSQIENADEVDIGALVNEIMRDRKEFAARVDAAKQANQAVAELRDKIREESAYLRAALNGPRKKRRDAGIAGAPHWPLEPHAKTRAAILKELDDVGAMTRAELRDTMKDISAGALSQALYALVASGMIEKLSDGSYGLTAAQQALMRTGDGAD